MKTKPDFWESLRWLKNISNNVLTVYAVTNVILLLLYTVLVDIAYFAEINKIYTHVLLYLLVFNFLCGIGADKFSIFSLRARIPDIVIILIGIALIHHENIFQLLIITRQAGLNYSAFYRRYPFFKRFKSLSDNAAIFVLLSFLITILVGTILLLLPLATTEGNTTSFTGALFTSTSATCVTGLIVYDTGTHFTLFGQIIILILIQIGGLGIMTISTSFAILTGQRLSFRGESIMQNVINEQTRFDMMRLIRNIVFVTLIFEFIGALTLFSAFSDKYHSTSMAAYSAVFHSISAFCNAGFSLHPDSFVMYRSHIGVNMVMMLLIIFGGLGFSVLVDLKRNLLEKISPGRLTLHTKIVLVTTAALLLVGFVLYFFAEFNHSMQTFNLHDRVLSSMFQSVTSRTAGFNTTDTSQFSKSSVFVSLILMFIGASPGSTGGGIKTTSIAVIVLSVIAILSSNRDVLVFKRKLSESLIKRVMALIAVSTFLLFVVLFILMLIEPFPFEHLIFEAFSAFGTVGLSMGITPYLSEGGMLLITLLMYFGRIGPLTFIFALSRARIQTDYMYSEEKISVG